MVVIKDCEIEQVAGGVQPGEGGEPCTPDPMQDVLASILTASGASLGASGSQH